VTLPPEDLIVNAESDLALLRLLHLADTALPIGSLAHSFGVESLVAQGLLTPKNLHEFLCGFLQEAGLVEAVFCRHGFALASPKWSAELWLELNEELSARKVARESRAGSASLGRNFLSAVNMLGEFPTLQAALISSKQAVGLIHHAPAFGLAGGTLGFDENTAVLAFLHQSASSLISSFQRLLPLGQSAATRLLWELKPTLLDTAKRSLNRSLDDAYSFMPLLDGGAMEHPALTTRLFVS
jgi:urease accessory protein